MQHNIAAKNTLNTSNSGEKNADSLPARYLAIVARPQEIDRTLVNKLHRLTRKLDDDPYGDCLWGLVTGREASDALVMIKDASVPLVPKRAMGTTGFDARRFEKSFIITDWSPNQYAQAGLYEELKKEEVPESPEGMVFRWVEAWKDVDPEMIITSAHATQYNLEMPFGKGLIASMDGKFHVLRGDQLKEFAQFLRGAVFEGSETDLKAYIDRTKAPVMPVSTTPKIWIAAGNCLFGDAHKSPNSMVVTAISAAGCKSVVGYTVPSWYGKGGWGTLSTFTGTHDDMTLAEAFFLNNQAILDETITTYPALMQVSFDDSEFNPQRLETQAFIKAITDAGIEPSKDTLGLVHDRDSVAFYGDPARRIVLDPSTPVRARYRVKPTLSADGTKTDEVIVEFPEDFEGTVLYRFPRRFSPGASAVILQEQSVSASSDEGTEVAPDEETPSSNMGGRVHTQKRGKHANVSLLRENTVLTSDFMLLKNVKAKRGDSLLLIDPKAR